MTGGRTSREIGKHLQIHTLHDYIEHNAVVMPTAAAVIQPEGDVVSFMELEKWAVCIACKVADAGIGLSSGSAVGVAAAGCSIVVGILGVWKTGNPYVPLASNLPPNRVHFIIQDVG